MRWAERRVAEVGALTASLVAAVTAVVVRLWLLTTPALELDGDEAVTGLVARGILDGEHRAYYAGQHYMGTFEQYLQAAFLAVDRDSSFVLRIPQALFGGLACYLVYRVALACGLRPLRAVFASAMFAVGPYFLVFWGVKSRGAYAIAMVLGLAALLVVLSVPPDGHVRWRRSLVFGLLCGLAFWSNQQAAFVLVPTAWWLWPHLRSHLPENVLAAAGGFVVGAAPAIWHSAETGVTPLGAGGLESAVSDRFTHFFEATIPDFIGLRDGEDRLFSWFPPPVVFGVAVGVLLLVVAVVRRRGLGALLLLETRDRSGVDLLLAILLLAPVISLGVGSSTRGTARYIFVLYPVALMLVAATPVPRRLRSPALGAAIAAAVVGVMLLHTWYGSANLIAEEDGGYAVVSGATATEAAAAEITSAGAREGVETAYADYWLAYLVNWAADGSLVVDPIYTPRFEDIRDQVRADPSPALIVNEVELADVAAALDERGRSFSVLEVGEWRIVTDISPGVHFERPASTVADALEGLAAHGP